MVVESHLASVNMDLAEGSDTKPWKQEPSGPCLSRLVALSIAPVRAALRVALLFSTVTLV